MKSPRCEILMIRLSLDPSSPGTTGRNSSVRNRELIRRWSPVLPCTNAAQRYTVAYVQFFDRELERNNGDWKKLLHDYLFPGPEPLINGFCGGRTYSLLQYNFQGRLPLAENVANQTT